MANHEISKGIIRVCMSMKNFDGVAEVYSGFEDTFAVCLRKIEACISSASSAEEINAAVEEAREEILSSQQEEAFISENLLELDLRETAFLRKELNRISVLRMNLSRVLLTARRLDYD